jgi:hypothetical protein
VVSVYFLLVKYSRIGPVDLSIGVVNDDNDDNVGHQQRRRPA